MCGMFCLWPSDPLHTLPLFCSVSQGVTSAECMAGLSHQLASGEPLRRLDSGEGASGSLSASLPAGCSGSWGQLPTAGVSVNPEFLGHRPGRDSGFLPLPASVCSHRILFALLAPPTMGQPVPYIKSPDCALWHGLLFSWLDPDRRVIWMN